MSCRAAAPDGSVTVKKGTTGVVLVLDGLTLTCGDSAAIACNKSTEVTIVAADGTVNTLADTEQNNDETYPDNDSAENAVIKCKDGSQVTLCGSGTLNVTANGQKRRQVRGHHRRGGGGQPDHPGADPEHRRPGERRRERRAAAEH